eukprot:6372830-Amphidinium_carterae.3
MIQNKKSLVKQLTLSLTNRMVLQALLVTLVAIDLQSTSFKSLARGFFPGSQEFTHELYAASIATPERGGAIEVGVALCSKELLRSTQGEVWGNYSPFVNLCYAIALAPVHGHRTLAVVTV